MQGLLNTKSLLKKWFGKLVKLLGKYQKDALIIK